VNVKVVAGLGLLVVLVFLPAVTGGGVFFQRDIHAYWYPHIENAVRAVADGTLPAWNPYVSFGRPLLADPNFQLLYPPTWLNLVMQPWVYYTAFVVLHCWAAGVGLFLLARSHALSVPASALAGALWMISGPLLSAANLFHHFAGAAWIAWVLWAFSRAMQRPTLPRALVLGAAAGGQALAGSADLCLLTALTLAPRVLLALWEARAHPWPILSALARMTAVAGVFGFLVAAAQWIPVVAILDAGSRLSQSHAASAFWSVHPASLLDLVVPRLLADAPLSAGLRQILFEGRGPLLTCLYLGAGAAPLAALGLLGRPHPLRAWAAAGFTLLVLLALGRYTPVYGLLASVPPYSMLRYPMKYMIPAALCWATLTGLGLEMWRASWTSAERRRAGALAAATVALALATVAVAFWMMRHPEDLSAAGFAPGSQLQPVIGKLKHAAVALGAAGLLLTARVLQVQGLTWSTVAIAVLAVVDLGLVGRHINALAPPEFYRFRPPLAEALRPAGDGARLFVQQAPLNVPGETSRRQDGLVESEVGWALYAQQTLRPPIGARWQISGSYDGDFTGVTPKLEATLIATAHRLGDPRAVIALLRSGGVTHVASVGRPPLSGLRPAGAFETVYGETLGLYEVPDPVPRAYLAYGVRALDEKDLPMLLDPAFAASREVILPPGTPALPVTSHAPRGSAHLRRPSLDRLEVDVTTSDPAWLVVLEAAHPGWSATVDGAPAPVLTANFLFRAILVSAGTHTVRMQYRVPGLRLGLLLSTTAAVIGLAVFWRNRSQGARSGPRLLTSPDPLR
jgi:hypothetical protein